MPIPKTALAVKVAVSVVALPVGPSSASDTHVVRASSFAYPADIVAYESCRAGGRSLSSCLRVGDNGLGAWGDNTTDPAKPICALPPEDWEAKWGSGAAARGRKIEVAYRGKTVICELRDSMFPKAEIRNGAGIDLNPGVARAFGMDPPFMLEGVRWRWSE